eukprot:NODE_297_length_11469_cov_0.855937.p5 type:complete len:301 gc:universal NODE_297_length_11469_cov_0.855937:8788-9690(+)
MNFQNYPHASLASSLTEEMMSAFPNHFKLSWIQTTEILMVVYGTLPVPYKNSWYNIPIEFVLPKLFPVKNPLVKVVPTENMSIYPSAYVNNDGRVSIPYLQSWSKSCTLRQLCAEMIEIFRHQTPVYSSVPTKNIVQKSPVSSDYHRTPIQVTQYDPLHQLRDDVYYNLLPLFNQLEVALQSKLNKVKLQSLQVQQSKSAINDKFNQISNFILHQHFQRDLFQNEITKLNSVINSNYDEVEECFIPSDSNEFQWLVKKETLSDILDILQTKFENKEINVNSWMKLVNQLAREQFYTLVIK